MSSMPALSEALGASYGAPTPELFPKHSLDPPLVSKWWKKPMCMYPILLAIVLLLLGILYWWWSHKREKQNSINNNGNNNNNNNSVTSPSFANHPNGSSMIANDFNPDKLNAARLNLDHQSPYNYHFQKKYQDAIALSAPNNSAPPVVTPAPLSDAQDAARLAQPGTVPTGNPAPSMATSSPTISQIHEAFSAGQWQGAHRNLEEKITRIHLVISKQKAQIQELREKCLRLEHQLYESGDRPWVDPALSSPVPATQHTRESLSPQEKTPPPRNRRRTKRTQSPPPLEEINNKNKE